MLLQSEIYQEEFKKNFVKNLIKVNENKNSLSRINFFDENIKKILFDQDQGKAQSIGDLFVRACLLDDISQERSFDFYEKNFCTRQNPLTD